MRRTLHGQNCSQRPNTPPAGYSKEQKLFMQNMRILFHVFRAAKLRDFRKPETYSFEQWRTQSLLLVWVLVMKWRVDCSYLRQMDPPPLLRVLLLHRQCILSISDPDVSLSCSLAIVSFLTNLVMLPTHLPSTFKRYQTRLHRHRQFLLLSLFLNGQSFINFSNFTSCTWSARCESRLYE